MLAVACLLLLLSFPALASGQKLNWLSQEGYRVAALAVLKTGKTGFTLMANEQLGVRFTNTLSMISAMINQNLLSGAGVAAGDYDGDGLIDLYFCNLEGRNALYHNLGDWKFEDVTDAAGVGCTNQFNTGAVFADVNGDGRLDLLVASNGGPNACFLNQG